MKRRSRFWPLLFLLPIPFLLGCSNIQYYWQATNGQLDIMRKAQPIEQALKNPKLSAETRRKLELVQRVRRFAIDELKLPDHGSYQAFSDLGRPFVVWNVFSAPELSIQLRTSCFPIAGCVGYKGFFKEADAKVEGQRRKKMGDDVIVGGVRAYSTLGYLKDPVLSSMLDYSDSGLIRVIIHEMSHPSVYAPGDTTFNESYAMTIENEGMRRWLDRYGSDELRREDEAEQVYNKKTNELLLKARADLQQLYKQTTLSMKQKREEKKRKLDKLHQQMNANYWAWRGESAEGLILQRPNNASLGAVAAYADLVPDFTALLRSKKGDIPSFIEAVNLCAKKPQQERMSCLQNQTQ